METGISRDKKYTFKRQEFCQFSFSLNESCPIDLLDNKIETPVILFAFRTN